MTSPEHSSLARELSSKSMTLLVNNRDLLPINLCNYSRVAVIGDASTISGGGSGHVEAAYIVTPADGLLYASQVDKIIVSLCRILRCNSI